jgi:phosphonate dehydrogenase
VYHDAHPVDAAEVQRLGVRYLPLDELLGTSDVVIPLLPLTADTLLWLDADRLRQLKPGALLVNVARGSLVDEEAVADALEAGRLGGYAADVFAMEDLARADRPRSIPARLLAAERTLFTPHLGSAVADVRRRIELHAARSIEQALAGERPDGAVNDLGARA